MTAEFEPRYSAWKFFFRSFHMVGCLEGHMACKKLGFICWWWWFDWSFTRLLAPVVSTTSIALSSNNNQNGDVLVLVLASPDPSGKWPLKWREMFIIAHWKYVDRHSVFIFSEWLLLLKFRHGSFYSVVLKLFTAGWASRRKDITCKIFNFVLSWQSFTTVRGHLVKVAECCPLLWCQTVHQFSSVSPWSFLFSSSINGLMMERKWCCSLSEHIYLQ